MCIRWDISSIVFKRSLVLLPSVIFKTLTGKRSDTMLACVQLTLSVTGLTWLCPVLQSCFSLKWNPFLCWYYSCLKVWVYTKMNFFHSSCGITFKSARQGLTTEFSHTSRLVHQYILTSRMSVCGQFMCWFSAQSEEIVKMLITFYLQVFNIFRFALPS